MAEPTRYAYSVPVDEIPKLAAIADYFGKDLVRVRLIADSDDQYDCIVWIDGHTQIVRVHVSPVNWVRVIS